MSVTFVACLAFGQGLNETPEEAGVRKAVENLRAEQSAFWLQARTLLMKRKFAELDAMASDLRRTRPDWDDGYPKLIHFYDALTSQYAQHPQKEHVAAVEAWRKAKPHSVAAIVASGRTYITYAWIARGGGYGSMVSPEGQKEFDRLLKRADSVLKSADPAAGADPGYQIASVEMAASSCDVVRKVGGSKEVRAAPDIQVLRTIANFLLPRWCGSPEEYRAFTEWATNLTRGQRGEMVYAVLAADAYWNEKDTGFAQYGFDWAKIRQGFDDAFRKYPKAVVNYHWLARMCYPRRDIATARELFKRPELAWLPGVESVWGSREQYESIRKWALRIR